MKLSIIIPVFNEEKYISEIIKKLKRLSLPDIQKEIIIVNDASTDKTADSLIRLKKEYKDLQIFTHKKNEGKGGAVRTAINHATGDYILIQDADLEYDPRFIPSLLKPIGKSEDVVVYGTRLKRRPNLKGEENHPLFLLHYFGNRLLSFITSICYGQWITDMETCYKLFPRKALDGVVLHARGFELEPEITAKLLKKKYVILEVPITTVPRGYDEGKKLHAGRDGMKALWALLRYRVTD